MKIAAIIVSYNPDIELLRSNIDAISCSLDFVIVFDNHSDNRDDIISLCEEFKNSRIMVILSDENVGISKAINLSEDTLPDEYDWFLTLDQDSICPENIISEYRGYISLPGVAMMSPVIQLPNGRQAQARSCCADFEYVSKCITSACLVKREAFREVGKMDEQLFIDNVDHDLCKRFLIGGYKIIRCNNVTLFHNMGSSTPVPFFKTMHKYIGTKVVYQTYSPFRIYFIIRNSIYCLRKFRKYYSSAERWYYIKLMVWHVTAKSLVVGDKRGKIVSAIVNGVKDGFRMEITPIKQK